MPADTVLADFFSEHEQGRTPNPCARCNEHIKFGAFLRRAEDLGIDFVATGHYVRTVRERGARRLLRGLDPAKDQSYMLYTLGQQELARSLFPVGGQTKAETRAHARRFGLPVATKPDSQEVCFVPDADHARFLQERAPHLVRSGEIVDTAGAVLGLHEGTFRYTVGQRRGLGVSIGERTFVLDLDHETSRVTWVAGQPPSSGPFEAEVRIRYRGVAAPSVVVADGDRMRVEFRQPQRAIAPGQAAVVYDGEALLGGGRIVESIR